MDTGSASNTFRHSFEFESVAVTPGSAYAIRLTSDDSEDAAVSPAGWPVNNYNGGGLFVDGKPTYGDLYFAFFHSGGVGEILDKMKPWRPFPLNKSAFVVAMFLTAAGTFGWLLWMVIAGLPVVGKQNTSDGDAEPSSSSAPSRTAGSSASVTPRPSGTATP